MKKINANEIGACISEALDDGKKTIEAEEDPFAGAPGLDSTLEWSVEAYYLVLLAKDISEIEKRTDIRVDDWLWAARRFET